MRYSKLLTAVVFPFVFVLCLLLTNADTYNIDVKTVRKFRGPEKLEFGWSVAQYKEKGVSWLIVGAPAKDYNGGAVYRCDPKTDNSCSVIKSATNGTKENSYYQRLGIIVRTSGVDDVILTCDTWYREKGKGIGMCYLISDNFTKIVEFSLCRQGNLCINMHAASISQDSKFIYIKTSDGYKDYIISVMKDAVYDKQFDYYTSQAMMPNSTIYVKGITSDTLWLDYSAPIKLPITSKEEGFVDGVVMVGRRTSNKEFKEVLVYTWDFTKVKTLVIDKVDAHWSDHWICVADVDGDGKQDIIVAVEVGKRYNIYVYYQGGHVCSLNDQKCWENTFNRTTILDNYDYSKTPRVHYLASLGDINQDGCEDFAVAVKSETFTDSAVYIYHGSVDGVRNQPSQILGAREITGITSPFRFGYSIAGGFDLDNNGYPDITVGSNNVVYHFRSKPVVRVMANLTYLLNTKYIDINQTVSRNITLRLCLKYTGVGVHPTSELNTTVTLDSLKPDSPRLIFNGQRLPEVFTLTKNDTMCKDYVTILKCIIEDTSTPIVANLNYSLLDSNYTELGQVLDPYYIGKHNDSLFIKYDGVSVNICIPELDLKLTSDVEIYRAETCDKVVVNVTIENRKDDSFGTKLYLDIPLGLTYVKVDQSTGTKDLIYCHSLNQTALICDFGNPLPGPASVKFGLIFQPVYVDTKMWNYTFVGILNCTNPHFKPTAADNVKTFVLPILPNVNISLTGLMVRKKGSCRIPSNENGRRIQVRCLENAQDPVCSAASGMYVPSTTFIMVNCESGYTLNNDDYEHSICFNEQWIPRPPSCTKLCPKLKIEDYMKLVCSHNGNEIDCSSAMLPGTRVFAECKYPYVKVEDYLTYRYINCKVNGDWDAKLFTCAPGKPEHPYGIHLTVHINPVMVVNSTYNQKNDLENGYWTMYKNITIK